MDVVVGINLNPGLLQYRVGIQNINRAISKVMITKQTNEIISVFVTPEKLREIAGCLERQKERAGDQTGLSLPSAMNVVEGLDSLHTQLHSDSTTVWFRLPTEEQGVRDLSPLATSILDEWAVHPSPGSQRVDGRLDNGSTEP